MSRSTIRDELDLTPRQRQIYNGMLQGKTVKQVATELGIRPHTAYEYCKTIYNRFGVHGQLELLAKLSGRGDSP